MRQTYYSDRSFDKLEGRDVKASDMFPKRVKKSLDF